MERQAMVPVYPMLQVSLQEAPVVCRAATRAQSVAHDVELVEVSGDCSHVYTHREIGEARRTPLKPSMPSAVRPSFG